MWDSIQEPRALAEKALRGALLVGTCLIGLGNAGGLAAAARQAAGAKSQAKMPSGSDPMFNAPYIDVDEVRSGIMAYRYVHPGSGTADRNAARDAVQLVRHASVVR